MKYAIRLHFPTFNNVAEYEALVNSLRITVELEIQQVEIRGDSQLVNQVMKASSCQNDKIAARPRSPRTDVAAAPSALRSSRSRIFFHILETLNQHNSHLRDT